MTDARRGEIWMADFGQPLGHEQGYERPALVVSSDEWNRHAAVLVVLPLTTRRHGYPTRVELERDPGNGLSETSYARVEDIRSISDRRLVHRVGRADPVAMSAVSQTIRLFLDV